MLKEVGGHTMRLLVVEDEMDLCDSIAEGLSIDGYAVDKCYNGLEAFELLLNEPYDLVILDLNLPQMDGFEILSKIRKNNKSIKILILSARDSVPDKVTGLDLGANDYLAKPFDFSELEARIRSLLHRAFIQENTLLTFSSISLDTVSRTVFVKDQEIILTKKEFSLLEFMLLNPNRVYSAEELMEHVWNSEVDSFSNAIRVHIASLRKKIRIHLSYDPIGTKIGAGYYLNKGDNEC